MATGCDNVLDDSRQKPTPVKIQIRWQTSGRLPLHRIGMVAAAIELGRGERGFPEKKGRRAGLFVR